MKTIRIGIIGCGVIAPAHIESYRLLPDVSVDWACDLLPERAAEMARRHAIPKTTTRAAEVFADPAIDAVSICTPHDAHAPLSIEALAAGKDVLCEKPLSSSPDGLQAMLDAADRYPDRIFGAIFQHRFTRLFQVVRDLVAQGAFGKPLTAAMRHHCLRTADYYEHDAWRGTWEHEGGGVLINQSIHFLDLLQWVMGGVENNDGFFANIGHRGVIETEDAIVGILRFRNGAIGTVETTNASNLGWEASIDIHGTEGSLEIRDDKVVKAIFKDPSAVRLLDKAVAEDSESATRMVGKAYYGLGHPANIADFVAAVRSRRRPYVGARDAAETTRLVHELYKASRRARGDAPGTPL